MLLLSYTKKTSSDEILQEKHLYLTEKIEFNIFSYFYCLFFLYVSINLINIHSLIVSHESLTWISEYKNIYFYRLNVYRYLNEQKEDFHVLNFFLIIFSDFFQISGTAAKLGHPNAYHHCTLLVDSDKNNLKQALVKSEKV